MRAILTLVVVIFLLVSSCTKKKYPESKVLNEVEFFLKANINNRDYFYKAGLENYQIYPGYTQATSGLYSFTGEFKLNDCAGLCAGSIKLQINDVRYTNQGAHVDISAALSPRKYSYQAPDYEVKFKSSYNKQALRYEWDFGDGEKSSEINPVHVYKNKGVYNTRLIITGSNLCSSTIRGQVNVGFTDKITYVNIIRSSINGKSIAFLPRITGGKAPYTYLWNFGDGITSNISEPIHAYNYEGSYPVVLRVVDANKDTTYAYYNAVTQSDLSSCAANYELEYANKVSSASDDDFSQVLVTWVNESGALFESKKATQTTASNFEILSVEDYENDENGNRLKKIKVKFSCFLQGSSDPVFVNDAEAVIAVAYK